MNLQKIVNAIDTEVRPFLAKGRVATYIPALACISPEKFGMAVHTIDGDTFCSGDADERFSIQSISKVLTLTLALRERGDALWQRVGKEPSGDPFNSLIQLEYENGVPRNPLINAGAIVIADCLVSDFPNARQEIRRFTRQLGGSGIGFDRAVARSERETGFRNAALANLMKSFGNLNNDVDQVLDVYFHQCSLAMSCKELARAFCYLADSGRNGLSGEKIVTPRRSRRINSLMLTCGTYDRAGEFAFEIGLPAKSGVGGGIVAVVPGKLALCAWSPGLGPSGNSVAAMEAIKRFVGKSSLSVF